jgi:hypothetical protein
MLGGVHNKQSRIVGGSLTDFDSHIAGDNSDNGGSNPIVGANPIVGGGVNPNTVGKSIAGGEPNTVGKSIAGGSLADAILNRVNAPQEENIPKIVIPDTSVKETINPEEFSNTIIEQVRSMEDTSFSIAGVLNTAIVYMAKVIFVGFDIENKIMHNWVLFFVWLIIATIVFGIASGITNTNITFILYCCAIWIMALAILFVLIHPYRSDE